MQKILIADDDQDIQLMYHDILQDAGYIVESASNGEEALAKIEKGGYNLILLDVMMPKVDGLGVLDIIRTYPPQSKNGPVILMTNLSHSEIINDALQKGAKAYFIKSDVTPDQVLQKIKENCIEL